jgi:hypothetical protein
MRSNLDQGFGASCHRRKPLFGFLMTLCVGGHAAALQNQLAVARQQQDGVERHEGHVIVPYWLR